MGGGGGDGTQVVRFAPYIETVHSDFLSQVQYFANNTAGVSPYDDFTELDVDVAFFGTGYTISEFPSLYDMYGKFMAGLDIEVLYDQILDETMNNAYINEMISQQGITLSEDIAETADPRFAVGMRDINSVMSSSFVMGRALLETTRVKELNKFAAELRYKLIPSAQTRWEQHLSWNKNIVEMYAQIVKLFLSAKIDAGTYSYELKAKDALWPFTVYDYERAAIGALTGATKTQTGAEASQGQKAMAGALSGAAVGSEISPGWGTAIGAVVGGVAGYVM